MSDQSGDVIIDTHHLSRRFGELVAVRDVSISVHKGEIFGVLGPNGAGKSTTIRMLCGILEPSSGSGRVAGCDIVTEPERVKSRIGYMTQRFSLYEDLSVEENLRFYGGIYGIGGRTLTARIADVIARNGLEQRRKQLCGTLSGGWKQRVALASATIHEPPLIFLDEPTAGVDPVSRRHFWDEIHRIAADGTTILVTTHYMDEAERCHRLAFIFRGETLAVGTPAEIVAARRLRVVEFTSAQGLAAAEKLRDREFVDEVAHYGHMLRVATRNVDDPVGAVRGVLDAAGIAYADMLDTRPNVEDAFVSMVREDDRLRTAKGQS
jgi:ABC-2 type transport system ATP-binding protein